MQGMVDAFNASQDEVHVNHTPMTADDLYQKIPMTVQTGSGVPDVAVVHIERIPNFVTNEMLYAYDMDLINDAAGIVAENYNQAAWTASDIDGEHYGIPLDVHSYVTYINKDLFDKYDLNEFVADGYITFDEIRQLGDQGACCRLRRRNLQSGLDACADAGATTLRKATACSLRMASIRLSTTIR